jgi:uncharacterized protein YoxC
MSVITDTLIVLLYVVFLLLAVFAIPCVLQVWRTVKEMSLTLRILNEKLPGIMKNLDEITTEVNRTTATVQKQIEDISLIVTKMKGMLTLVSGLEAIVRRGALLPFVPTLRTVLAVSKGVRVFLSHLLSERRKSG